MRRTVARTMHESTMNDLLRLSSTSALTSSSNLDSPHLYANRVYDVVITSMYLLNVEVDARIIPLKLLFGLKCPV